MNTQANAKASFRKCHPDQQKTFDHDDGNDDFGPLGGWVCDDRGPAVTMPAPVTYRGIDVFDHHHVWDEPVASINITKARMACSPRPAGARWPRGTPAPSPVSSRTLPRTGATIRPQCARRSSRRRPADAIRAARLAAASTFLDVLGAYFIFEHEIGQSQPGPYGAWARSELNYFSIDIHGWSPPHGTIVIDVHHPPRSADRAGHVLWQLRASARTGRGARRRHLVRHYQCTYHSKTTSRS